jgi:hypothetical protein
LFSEEELLSAEESTEARVCRESERELQEEESSKRMPLESLEEQWSEE